MKQLLAGILTFLLACMCSRLASHGFEQYIANLAEDEPAALVDGKQYTVGELKTLLALRPPVPASQEFQFFGVREILETAREAPAWTAFAAEARSAGIQLTAKQNSEIDRDTREYIERILYRDLVLEKVERPTVDRLKDEYDMRKDLDFAMPERYIIREVFVPAAADAEDQIRTIHKRMEDGESLSDLQREISGDEAAAARIVVPGEDDIPVPVLQVLRKLNDRMVSEPVQSDLGWHIVQRQLHIPGGNMPFEAVFPLLLDEWLLVERSKAVATVFEPLAEDVSVVEVRTQYLLNTGALALDTDVLMSVGDREFTRGELADAAGWQLNRETPLTESTFLKIAAGLGPVQDALLDTLIARSSQDEPPAVAFFRKAKSETLLVQELLKHRFVENKGDLSNEAGVHDFLRSTIEEKAKETALEPYLLTSDTGY